MPEFCLEGVVDDMAVRKEFDLQGLCCADCAAEIERDIGRLEGVDAASVDFAGGTLSVEIASEEAVPGVLGRVDSILRREEPDLVVREREPRQAGKRTVFLSGLCCADCAREIEDRVGRLDGVRSASLDFVTGRLTLEARDRDALPGLIRRAGEVVKSVEPEAEVSCREPKPREDEAGRKREKTRRVLLAAGAMLFAAAFAAGGRGPAAVALFVASYLLTGGEVLLRSARNLLKGRVFDENFLMSVATIGAFSIGEFAEGVAVMLFYQVGELFQRVAVGRSRRSVAALMELRPEWANLMEDGEVRRVAPEEVGVGEKILVRPGEKVPLDGTVVDGVSSVDVSALTGESLPKDVGPGDAVLSGSIDRSGVLTVRVAKEYADSTVAKILDLVQNAGSKKTVTENFITRFARWYTPLVVFGAVALAVVPPLFVPGAVFSEWLRRALVFLVVSCPCALVLSVPLSFFGGIGAASRNGILVKGSNYLEALYDTDTIVFDKTGTLTKGVFRVTRVKPAGGVTEDGLLDLAAHAEAGSNHPIALSIRQACGKEIDRSRIAEASEAAGLGISVKIDGRPVLVGNGRMMESRGIPHEAVSEPGTVVYVAVDGAYAGSLLISDEIREDSGRAASQLRREGIRRLVMLTGDSRSAGEKVAEKIGLDEVHTDLLPGQKVEMLEKLRRENGTGKKIAFVGDGVNDAPVLAAADVGIAMGGAGSDAAIEAADVVLMTDELSLLPLALRVARRTRRIVRQNIAFALGVKAVILVLGALGIATLWAAVFGDVGVAVLAVLNAMRALRVPAAGSLPGSVRARTGAGGAG